MKTILLIIALFLTAQVIRCASETSEQKYRECMQEREAVGGGGDIDCEDCYAKAYGTNSQANSVIIRNARSIN